MAAFLTYLLLFSLPCISWGQILGQITLRRSTRYVPVQSCNDGSSGGSAEFFNSVNLKCQACPSNSTTSADGTTCICDPGFRLTKSFGGATVQCSKCNDAVSEDGWECVTCDATASINPTTGKCESCPVNEINVLRLVDGSFVGANSQIDCQTCQAQTQPNADNSRCERCDTTLSIGRTTCDCAEKGGGTVVSAYLTENVRADHALCNFHNGTKACQSLANMCVLLFYDPGSSRLGNTQACSLFYALNFQGSPLFKPEIVTSSNAEDETLIEEITTQWTLDPVMDFPFIAGTWSLDGQFEGFQNITGKFLQLCDAPDNILNAAFTFGTFYSYSCSIPALNLWDQVKYPLKFYELYLAYNPEGGESIFRIPVKIINYVDIQGNPVNERTIRQWQLMRRFFMVDNVMAQPQIDQDVQYVRYLSSIKLIVDLQDDTADGLIYIPVFEMTYSYVAREDALKGATVKVSFTSSYGMDQFAYFRNFQISTGVLSSLGLVYAGFRSYVWSKRAGRLSIDFPTLVNFFFYLCGSLANAFFVISYGIAFYYFIFYKRQNVVYLVPLQGQSLSDWEAIFITGFVLKALSLVHMIVMQCSADLFMVDWERPKGQGAIEAEKAKHKNTVSIWRTYFVANEWNEIQTKRKINKVFQIFAVLFFLHVVGFEDTSTKDPDGTVGKSDDVYQSEQSIMFRMALATTVYLLVDDIREFVDLCSMSNVSVFVMANAEFGYYIHGRSVHGRSDVDMQEMCDMIKREEDNLVGMRGLQPNTEFQTFIMCLPKRLRQKYETVYMPVQLENASAATQAEQGRAGVKDKSIEAYNILNRFLCAFIDHSLRDVDYVVKDKNFLEKVLDTEFLELTDKGIFYNDNGHSFDNVLFYGNELFLIVFDTLLFCVLDRMAENFVLAGILTFIIIEGISLAREMGGKKNLAKKTLVDERFLI